MKEDKILVEIASYCDPELLNTINSALVQADYPDRVCFAVCYQSDDEKDYKKLLKIKNCKVKWLKEKEAKGSCYARTICQKMIDDEKYVYQIDSHMRFVKHWDTKLIEDLLSINDEKAIISFYPPGCDEKMLKLPFDDKQFDNPVRGGVMYATKFRSHYSPFISVCCSRLSDDDKTHLRGAIISAGNFFSFSDVHKEVFLDDDMFFHGDELCMSIYLFTHGWNVYSSENAYIYHQYCRENRKFPKMTNAVDNEIKKLKEIIKNKNNKTYLKEHNIGTVRTIDEFEKFSGIDFENRKLYLTAITGYLDNEKYIGKISYLCQKDSDYEMILNRKNIIEILIVDLYGDYQECIKNCLSNAEYKDQVKFIVGSTKKGIPSQSECNTLQIKEFISFDENSYYCGILNKITKKLDNNSYALVADSTIRFMKEWDKYLIENIALCGDKALLTNWLWLSHEGTKSFVPYINIVKNVKNPGNYLPALSYNESINLSNIKLPYQVETFFDGFMFCTSKILKEIEIDPNLNYEENKYIYSIRLWTYGVNIYIPKLSYFYRVREEKELMFNDKNNNNIVDALSGISSFYSNTFEANYPYDIGRERPLWTWYKFLNVEYDVEDKKIIND